VIYLSAPGRLRPHRGEAGLELRDEVLERSAAGLLEGRRQAPPCHEESLSAPGNLAVLDFDGDGTVSIADAVALVRHLFSHGPPPALGASCIVLPRAIECFSVRGCD
jgi:hypothetical protein